MPESVLTDQEAKLFALSFSIVNEWATEWVAVLDGTQTKEQAFDSFNEYLKPVGQVLAVAVSLPGVAEQVLRLQEESQETSLF